MLKLTFLLAIATGLALPVGATVVTWSANLSSSQEIPPTVSSGTGFGTVQFDDTTNLLELNLSWQGLTGDAVQAHIHCCVANPPGTAGIALDLWLPAAPRPAAGIYSVSYDLDTVNPFRSAFTTANGGTSLSAMSALITAMNANQGRSYYNIHTAIYPGGEIRGDLSAVPEPSTLIGLASGVALLLLRRCCTRT